MNSLVMRLGGLFLMLSCIPALANASERNAFLENFSCHTGPFRLKLPKAYPEIRKLGPIQNEKQINQQKWDAYTTTEYELQFPGLHVALITFSNSVTKFYPLKIIATAPEWTVTGPFRVGEPMKKALHLIGHNYRMVDDYFNVIGDGDELFLKAKNGKITEVIYECYAS